MNTTNLSLKQITDILECLGAKADFAHAHAENTGTLGAYVQAKKALDKYAIVAMLLT